MANKQNANPGSLERVVTRHVVSVQLTPEEVNDLRMLKYDLVEYQPMPWFKCEKRRDAERYMRLVDKILRAV
jgi:hypothetical protein